MFARTLLAAVACLPALAATAQETSWTFSQTIDPLDDVVVWTSPTAADLQFATYDYAYEITGVGAYYSGIASPDDLTSRFATAMPLEGDGRVLAVPSTFLTIPVDEPYTLTQFDMAMSIDAQGFGQVTFSDIALGSVPVNFGENRSPITRLLVEGTITLVGDTSPAGDYNDDLVVDESDYLFWSITYGSSSILNADGNGDGLVNAADYTIWRDNFSAPAAVIPEPLAAALLAAGLVLAAAVRPAR